MDEWMDKMITISPFGNEDDYVLLGSVIPPKTVIISDYSQYDTSALHHHFFVVIAMLSLPVC